MMDEETNDGRSAEFKYEVKDFSAKLTTTDEITARFDTDFERFSNLETGQSAKIDAPLSMQLITEAAVCLTPQIERVLVTAHISLLIGGVPRLNCKRWE